MFSTALFCNSFRAEVVFVYLSFGLLGYFTFGQNTHQNVITNYSISGAHEDAMFTTRFAFSLIFYGAERLPFWFFWDSELVIRLTVQMGKRLFNHLASGRATEQPKSNSDFRN